MPWGHHAIKVNGKVKALGLFLLALALSAAPVCAQRMSAEAARALVTVHTWPDHSALRAGPLDTASARQLKPVIDEARVRVEQFFGARFQQPVNITLVSDRAAFSAVLKAEWGMPETACWMVATGVADFLVVLSPRVWRQEACEHDPADSQHVRDIITHELVHAYHGQHHPSRDFDFPAADEMGWFIEGLASYASGQLDGPRLASAQDALAANALPARLQDAWSGKYRYGVSGSMVRFIDQRFGRRTLIDLLPMAGNAAVLERLHLSESEFLAAWRQSLRALPP